MGGTMGGMRGVCGFKVWEGRRGSRGEKEIERGRNEDINMDEFGLVDVGLGARGGAPWVRLG